MPCPTGSFKIISRGKGQSCMASCAYYSGEKKYSEYECCWKYPHSSPARVKWVEVMLPSNAPRAYADPQTLWNAVDAAETSVNAQTARSMFFALPCELTDEQNLPSSAISVKRDLWIRAWSAISSITTRATATRMFTSC